MGQHKKLFPTIALENRREKNHILTVSSNIGPHRLKYMKVDVETNQIIHNQLYDIDHPEEWFDTYPFEEIKAVTLNCSDTKPDQFSTNYAFREMIAKKLHAYKVPYYFTTRDIFSSTLVLIAAGVEPKVGERVLTIGVMLHVFMVAELIRKEDTYEIQRKKMVFILDERQWQRQKFQILGTTVPDKIVAASMAPSLVNAKFMKILKEKILKSSKNVTIIDDDITCRIPRLVNNLVENMYDPDFNTYHITPCCEADIAVSLEQKLTNAQDALIIAKECERLPLKKSCVISRTNATFYVSFLNGDSGKYEVIKRTKFNIVECHRMKLKLIVDENNLPFIYHKDVTVAEIVRMCSKLSAQSDLECPVIGFYDCFSVISLSDQTDYSFLKTWNGLYGKDLFITFDEKEPKLITALKKLNPESVIKVADLLKLMSMPPGSVKKYKKWNFSITKDSKNPILIEFEDSRGMPHKASPAFLMSLVLKEHMNAIKSETGVKAKKLGIWLFNEFDGDARKRIEARFEEACKLLNVEFCFVDF